MKVSNLVIALSIASTVFISGCETYGGYPHRGDVYNKDYGQNHDRVYDKRSPGVFSDNDKRLIRDYYSDHGRNKPKKAKKLPKGLQKKYARTGQLPRGWQMKMVRGEVIPHDIYEHGRSIPYELSRRLPIGPVGSKILEIEGKIIRVIHNTREIVDILNI